MNNTFYLVFGIILALALINLGSLYWVWWLQRQLAEKHPHQSISGETAETVRKILDEAAIKRLENDASSHVKVALDNEMQVFQDDLGNLSGHIKAKVEELTDKVIQDELTNYQNAIGEVRQASVEMLSRIQASIEEESRKRAQDVSVIVEAEKKKVIEKFEQKMGDIVAGYLVEILGTNIDLGAQRSYIFSTLEAHKDELKQAINDGT